MFDKLLTPTKSKRKLINRGQKRKKTFVGREDHWADIRFSSC